LQQMNAVTLKFQKTRMHDDFPRDYQIEKITKFRDRFYLFYSLWENEQEQLYAREIDVAACVLKPAKKIITVNEKITGEWVKAGMWRVATGDKFDFFFAHDSSSMAIQYRLKPEKRDDSKSFDVIGMHVLTPDLTEKWGNTVKMPYTEKKMDNLTYAIDAKGNVYIVARVYNDDTTDEKKRGKDETNYTLEILKVAQGSGTVTSTKVDVGDKFVKTIWLYDSPQGNMICAGYYNLGKNADNTDGVLLFKLDHAGKASGLNAYEIPVEILNQYASGKSKRKNERKEDDDEAEATNMELRNVVIQKDGSVLLVGEQYYERMHSSYMNGQHSVYYTYHYNDILVTKIDPSGKLAWMKKLPKRQKGGSGSGGMSYVHLNGQNTHYFVYLDNIKNKDLPLTELPAVHVDNQGGFLTAYKVDDKTGDVVKLTLLDTRNIEGMDIFQFSPDRIVATSRHTFVFEVYKKKKEDVLVKVQL
jgi:hypothetical protein